MFFIFNLEEIDSNSDKRLIYSLNNLYEESYYTVHLNNIDSIKLDELLSRIDINIISYIIDDKKYYVNNIEELIEKYSENLSIEDKIYYQLNGVRIDAITTRCEAFKIMYLDKEEVLF